MSLVGNFTTNKDREDRFGGVASHNNTHKNDNAPEEESSEPEETPEETERRAQQEVAGLARTMSRRSDAGTSSDDPLRPEPDSKFDPWSDSFDARAWSKAVYAMIGTAHRTAGVAFENLGAYGYGTDSDYQSTVGNMPLKAWGMLKSLVSRNKGKRVQILDGVDGVLEPGDMLVVLGPPGRSVQALCLVQREEPFADTVPIRRGVARAQWLLDLPQDARRRDARLQGQPGEHYQLQGHHSRADEEELRRRGHLLSRDRAALPQPHRGPNARVCRRGARSASSSYTTPAVGTAP